MSENNKFPELSNPIIIALFNFTLNKGYQIYFVGGMVRDRILNIDTQDIDITTNAPLNLLASFITNHKECFSGFMIDKRYGTISTSIQINDGYQNIQISAMRSDTKTDGRHAEIKLTDSRIQDAKRRDFTINALYLTIKGKVYDDVNGLSDLCAGKIKFIGLPWKRIKEDYLRILRFYRFWGRFGKTRLSFIGRLSCRHYAKKLNLISNERIRKEVFGILQSKNVIDTVRMMNSDKISEIIFEKNIDTESLWYVVNKNADILLRLYIACGGNPKTLSKFVLTKSEKAFYNNLIHSLRNNKLGPKARSVVYGKEVCIADNILTNRAIHTGIIPDFSKIRSELAFKLSNCGTPNNELGNQIRLAYHKWLLSDCNLTISDLLRD